MQLLRRRARYADLPLSLRGSPGAVGRFRVVTIDLAALDGFGPAFFAFGVASVGVLLGVGWLRRLIGGMD